MPIDLPVLFTTPDAHEPATQGAKADVGHASRYVARILQQHLIEDPDSTLLDSPRHRRLRGHLGLHQTVGAARAQGPRRRRADHRGDRGQFRVDPLVAYGNGGSLLKFGGDALLLWFEGDGHVERACRATVLMRRALRDVGRIEVPGRKGRAPNVAGRAHAATSISLRSARATSSSACGARLEPSRRHGACGRAAGEICCQRRNGCAASCRARAMRRVPACFF